MSKVSRREFIIVATGAAAAAVAGMPAMALASANDSAQQIAKFTGGAAVSEGGVELSMPEIAENGNTVPLAVSVDSPMTADDHVQSVMVLAEGNPNAGYAQFRVGHAYFERIPTGWFLSPPVYERQQTFVIQATNELRRFVQYYPTNRLVPQAQDMLDKCQQMLFDHEFFAANFYRKRDKPKGVIIRLERAFRKYPEVAGGDEEAYVMLARAYADTQRFDEARAMYASYLERFPEGSFRGQAEESLTALQTVQ
mgnify:CR=1 FL=1